MRATKILFAAFLTIAPAAISLHAGDHDRDRDDRRYSQNQRYSEKELKKAERERDKAWRSYLKDHHQSYRNWNSASQRDRDDFYRYRRERGYPPLFYEQHPDMR